MLQKTLYLFTRTPLHIGSEKSVGAIDQPIVRERHTGFPIMPASSMKGALADEWNGELEPDGNGGTKRGASNAAWLFGSDDAHSPAAGAVQICDARLLAFPVRSAKGSFAWVTSPLILRRYVRDAMCANDILPTSSPSDDEAIYAGNILDINGRIVLEDYALTQLQRDDQAVALPIALLNKLSLILEGDPVWKDIAQRLVIVSDGMMSHFARFACEVAQHVRINDETGTAEHGGLYNQENVPSETLFYSVLNFFSGHGPFKIKTPDDTLREFITKLDRGVFQLGGDASSGLGYCSVNLHSL